MKEIGVGLLGFGTVGAGVVEGLQRNGELVAERIGARLCVRRIADIDLERDRGVRVDPALLTRDAAAVVRDPAVDIVVELIGGTGIARVLVAQAIEQGKPVVTANKALLAAHGDDIFLAAERRGVDVCFEASVAGGIPLIRALSRGLVADAVESVHGILNGTCNYILTRMTRGALSFDAALAEARAQGYAEADPSLDIDGHDTAHKAAILARLAFGSPVPLARIPVRGIRGLAREDIVYAGELGYATKLLASLRRVGGEIEIRVGPALVPHDHMLASVSGVFNAILVTSDGVGETLYYGRGAGRAATASAVISDLADVARKLAAGSTERLTPVPRVRREAALRMASEASVRCYLRMMLPDRPGILGRICTVLGAHGISIASIVQKEVVGVEGRVPVVFVTHAAREGAFQAALAEVERDETAGGETIRLRIEDFT